MRAFKSKEPLHLACFIPPLIDTLCPSGAEVLRGPRNHADPTQAPRYLKHKHVPERALRQSPKGAYAIVGSSTR